MDTGFKVPKSGVIFGHQPCQTREAKWLKLENVYEKSYRPNMYDIGGTYIEDVPEYWLYYKTEMVGKHSLMHILVCCRHEGPFSVSISCSSEISFRRRQHLAYFTSPLKTHLIKNAPVMTQNYLTTYSISEIDLEILKGMQIYIPISFEKDPCTTMSQLGFGFQALLDDPFGSDFTIETEEGSKFKVHKVFLRASSDVFRAMLKDNTIESQQNYLKMVDVNKNDLDCLLQFIYTGSLRDVEYHNYFNLIMLSDRYDLPGLKELSECALASQICLANVIDTLAVADLYNAENLKIAALKFIKCNKSIIHNHMFNALNNVELIREVCQFLVPKIEEIEDNDF